MKTSAIIITKNAETMIRRCVESVAWTDEVIVVDSGSTDRTEEICIELGVRFYRTPDFPGHGPQKNRALDKAQGEWIVSLDSDEWMLPELQSELEKTIADPRGHAAFAIPRRSSFCGRPMKHSGWWPDYVVRLFRRDASRFSEDHTHDRLIINGSTGKLRQPIMHEAITDLDQMIGKMNLYSTSSSRMFHKHGRRASIWTALLHGGWAFFRTYFLRLGFLDGREGFMLAVANGEGSYYRYLKLMLLCEKKAVTTAAVIATTYNRPDALRAVLEGLMCQDQRGFEVLIADDGSTGDTRQLVEQYAQRADFSLRHIWQEDLGFRPGAARNRALAATSAEYVIFIDGDCVPPPDFVRRHLALAEPGYFLGGNRVLLTETFTRRALAEQLPLHAWGNAAWLLAWLRRDINRLLPLLRLPDGAFRRSHPEQWEGIKSCNLSAWRTDLQRVNGFDEAYSGWGLEDSDLVIRLINAGIKHKSARFATPLFHLWHRESDRSQLPENQQRLDALLASPRIAATQGLNQYS